MSLELFDSHIKQKPYTGFAKKESDLPRPYFDGNEDFNGLLKLEKVLVREYTYPTKYVDYVFISTDPDSKQSYRFSYWEIELYLEKKIEGWDGDKLNKYFEHSKA